MDRGKMEKVRNERNWLVNFIEMQLAVFSVAIVRSKFIKVGIQLQRIQYMLPPSLLDSDFH